MAANNMISYSQHIWNDMRDAIQFIIDEHGEEMAIAVVHQGRQCERNPEYVDNLLISLSDDINEFINRTNRNRSALMRKIKQNGLKEDQFAGFYALVLISMHQAREFIEIRDMYRDFVVP